MEFEWDPNKRAANLAKHGLDFIKGVELFDGRQVYRYGSVRTDEERFVTVGRLQEEIVAAIWTERNGAIRLISLRRARDEEKRAYRALFG